MMNPGRRKDRRSIDLEAKKFRRKHHRQDGIPNFPVAPDPKVVRRERKVNVFPERANPAGPARRDATTQPFRNRQNFTGGRHESGLCKRRTLAPGDRSWRATLPYPSLTPPPNLRPRNPLPPLAPRPRGTRTFRVCPCRARVLSEPFLCHFDTLVRWAPVS